MDVLIQAMAVVGCLVSLGAVSYVWKLRKKVHQLTRESYYLGQKLKIQEKEIHDILETVRIQLAAVATGRVVSDELIRKGRLYHDISANSVKEEIATNGWLNKNGAVLIDVRTVREYESGHVPGAKLIPIEELESRYKDEIPSGTPMIVVYCANGERSRLACDYLSRQGYLNLYNMHDGWQQWRGEREGAPRVDLIQIQPKPGLSESQGIQS